MMVWYLENAVVSSTVVLAMVVGTIEEVSCVSEGGGVVPACVVCGLVVVVRRLVLVCGEGF